MFSCSWFPEVVNVFIDKNMLKHLSAVQVDAFYNSVSTLISNQVYRDTFGNRGIHISWAVARVFFFSVFENDTQSG